MTEGDLIAVDANVLLRLAEIGHPQNDPARRSVERLTSDGAVLVLLPQVVYEFWVVATRPVDVNGLGLSPDRVAAIIRDRLAAFLLVENSPNLLAVWLDIVERYAVRGKPAHDARLVAAMVCEQVATLLTFNVEDFRRYSEIAAVTPASVLAG